MSKVDGKVIWNNSTLSQSGSYANGQTTITKSSVTKTNSQYESKEGCMSDCESIDCDGTDSINITRISKTIFQPEYAARAHLNIYTGKELIKNLLYEIVHLVRYCPVYL